MTILFTTEQEQFWAGEFGDEYIIRNVIANFPRMMSTGFY
jgi:hypothetical protein